MNLRWVSAPCKDCPERHEKCHATCEKYQEYKKRHYEEKGRLWKENSLDKAIRELNYKSANKVEKVSPPLKHGRKRER